jgi:phosphatidylserine/phosphatidylglycerophosphate/cardiolipin synthase-like enzyme
MCALKVSEIAKDLRQLADCVEHRLWVASPYIGSWKAVRKILGSAWQKVDVRLLTDKDSGILARDTVEQIAAHRPVRSLEGLHAKLYILDDSVLLTSANLTEAAFTRRYEVGLVLKGQQARGLVAVFDGLWDRAAEVDVEQFSFTKPRNGNIDEPHRGGKLPKLATRGRANSEGNVLMSLQLLDGFHRIVSEKESLWTRKGHIALDDSEFDNDLG